MIRKVTVVADSSPVIDDKKAREIAEEMGIKCIGTLGILYKAREKLLIKKLKPLFLELTLKGRYYSIDILNHLLQKAGEDPIE